MKPILTTERLALRELVPDDAAFILALINDPDWHRFIGDRGIRTVDGARDYIVQGPMAMYARWGFGLWVVERRTDRAPIGLCGLIRRDGLSDVDIGFALLPAFRRHGYTLEAANAVLAHARDALKIARVVAIATRDNGPSAALLGRLGLVPSGTIKLPTSEDPLVLFAPSTVQ